MTAPVYHAADKTWRTSFGFKREYEDLDAEYHQQPRERVPPFTPKPYMLSVSSPAMALDEAARARRNVAECVNEPLLRAVHRDSHRFWIGHVKAIRERQALSRERARAQARMVSIADACVETTAAAVGEFRKAVEHV